VVTIFRNRNFHYLLAITLGGFILLNITFFGAWMTHRVIDFILSLIRPDGLMVPQYRHLIFALLIGLLSIFIFRSRLPSIYKAIYTTVPTAVLFITVGILLYRDPISVYALSLLLFVGLILIMYRFNLEWMYYYAVIIISLTLLIMNSFGMEI